MQTDLILGLTTWDWILIVIASWVAVTSLIRLMRLHRDQVIDRLRREVIEAQLRHRREQEQKQQNQQAA